MSPVVWIVVGVVAFDALLIFGLTRAIGLTWKRYAERWPPRAPAPDAVTRRFQSFRFGLLNAGWSVHVTVDEQHLHLVPARMLRWFGCRSVSIPWSDIAVRSRILGRWCTVRLADGTQMVGPSWCLELADGKEA